MTTKWVLSWWRHQMGTFSLIDSYPIDLYRSSIYSRKTRETETPSALLALCEGNPRAIPHTNGQQCGALLFLSCLLEKDVQDAWMLMGCLCNERWLLDQSCGSWPPASNLTASDEHICRWTELSLSKVMARRFFGTNTWTNVVHCQLTIYSNKANYPPEMLLKLSSTNIRHLVVIHTIQNYAQYTRGWAMGCVYSQQTNYVINT